VNTPPSWAVWTGAIILLMGGCAYREYQAESSAHAFCERFPAGSQLTDAAAAAATEGERVLRMIGEKEVRVGWVGIPPFSRYLCTIEAESGKVTKATTSHLD
jgi:hypothetical protein